jgi:hypothetical protein
MSTKTLLIILVLIAIVVGVAIGRGQRNKGDVKSKSNREDPPGQGFFGWLKRGGDTLAIGRMVGCGRSGRTLQFSGNCDAHIASGEQRQSRFILKAFSNTVQACYGFSMDQLKDCDTTDNDKKSWVKADGKSRFVVSKDEAFLRLYCRQPNGLCTVTVE